LVIRQGQQAGSGAAEARAGAVSVVETSVAVGRVAAATVAAERAVVTRVAAVRVMAAVERVEVR
jgi:hypothetical protein